jgi:hypothetical protein
MGQVDQFEALNRLRDELIDALSRENRDLKEQITSFRRESSRSAMQFSHDSVG